MIDVRDVTKFYRKGRLRVEVLRSVNLQAERGAFVALMGASGSGKTTLLNLIGGIDSPSSGSVEVKVNLFCGGAEDGVAVLLLDKRAVLQKDDARFAYVVEHGRAVLRPLDLTHGDDAHFQVLRGVREGDRLILNPSKDWPKEVAVKE